MFAVKYSIWKCLNVCMYDGSLLLIYCIYVHYQPLKISFSFTFKAAAMLSITFSVLVSIYIHIHTHIHIHKPIFPRYIQRVSSSSSGSSSSTTNKIPPCSLVWCRRRTRRPCTSWDCPCILFALVELPVWTVTKCMYACIL